MATPKLAPIKSDVHHLGKKPLPEFFFLKNEIISLWRDRRRNRYLLGEKLAELQTKTEHGKFLQILKKEIHIPVHTAYRAMKFFRRVKLAVTEQILQNAKFRAKFAFEDAEDFEKALESNQADERLKALDAIAAVEREKITRAAENKRAHSGGYRIVIAFSDVQKERFKKAWDSLTEPDRVSIVYKAVCDAAR
jgi:hypothetical protein